MSTCIHLGAAALNTTPKDWDGNLNLILRAIAEARNDGVTLLCLPELAITGYGCEDEFLAPYVPEWAMDTLLNEVAPATQGIAVALGLPIAHGGAVYNAIAMLADGELAGIVPKQNLAGDGIHYEPRFFKAWQPGRVASLNAGGQTVPLGDLVFEFAGVRVGFEICEDAWVADRPGAHLAGLAVDVILNPSASHFSFGKNLIRERFVQEGSRAFHSIYVYANLLGNEAGRAIYEGDCLIATEGEIIERSEPFQFAEFYLITATVDVDGNRVRRNRQASFRPRQGATEPIVFTPFGLETIGLPGSPNPKPRTSTRYEAFEQAIAQGLFDYLRKSRTNGFAISLSGGADSAACLVLVYLTAQKMLTSEIGRAYLQQTLGHIPKTAREAMAYLCVCAYQRTANSSDRTHDAAKVLADATGATFADIDVERLVREYEGILSTFLGRDLDWERDDIPRQNIQARCRAPAIWALANARNLLLLATSNRSEAAVGYCTMDGDTAGCLSPLAGIDKEFLLAWLKSAEERHIPELSAVNGLAPTAELRPAEADQTDEADLMPYPVLNRMQKLAVVQKKSPSDIFDILAGEHPGMSAEQVYQWIERYFTLWSRNQWKRERYAPAFHVDDENLDPRSWCRYPMLSGGYVAELRALRKRIKKEANDAAE